jgi:hypothetical protein
MTICCAAHFAGSVVAAGQGARLSRDAEWAIARQRHGIGECLRRSFFIDQLATRNGKCVGKTRA